MSEETESALRERDYFSRRVLHSLLNGIYIYDVTLQRNVFINNQYTELLGYTLDDFEEMTPEAMLALFHPDDLALVLEHMNQVVNDREDETFEIEYRFRTMDGHWAWCLSRDAVFSRDESGAVTQFIGTFMDVTERRQAQEELARHRDRLEEEVRRRTQELSNTNRELEAFSYAVAHDLRAPLRAVDGFSYALIEDCSDQLGEDGLDYLKSIRQAAGRMGKLIDGLLALSRASRGTMTRDSIDIRALAEDIADDLRRQHAERSVAFTCADGMTAHGDARLVGVIFANLLGNAWKFTRNVADAEVEVGTLNPDGEPVYYVRDNGAGFNAAYSDKLFAPFQRLHRQDEFEGAGIGLATVQRIVHRHGGSVWAEGEPGKGATFYFTLGR